MIAKVIQIGFGFIRDFLLGLFTLTGFLSLCIGSILSGILILASKSNLYLAAVLFVLVSVMGPASAYRFHKATRDYIASRAVQKAYSSSEFASTIVRLLIFAIITVAIMIFAGRILHYLGLLQ